MEKNLRKKLFIFILLVITLSTFGSVTAAPPQEFKPLELGVIISYPPLEYLEKSNSYIFNFRTFNETDGVHLTDDFVSCAFYLCDDKGRHILNNESLDFNDEFGYFNIHVDAGNFTREGVYFYQVQCNNSYYGGYILDDFVVRSHEVISLSSTLLFLILGVLIIFLILGVYMREYTIIAISSFVMMCEGVYIATKGINALNNLGTQALAICLIAVGAYFLLKGSMEIYKNMIL